MSGAPSPASDRPISGERGLAAAVIAQAWADCTSPHEGMTVSDLHASWNFLTSASGRWASARALWCDMCDLHPDTVRQRALAQIPYHRSVAALLAVTAARTKRERARKAAIAAARPPKPPKPPKPLSAIAIGQQRAAQIKEDDLRRMVKAGMSQRAIAAFYGVAGCTIHHRIRALREAAA